MYCIGYEVKEGDTLYHISRHFNVSISAILDANPFANLYQLIAGEEIYIPVGVPRNDFTHYTTYQVGEEDTLGALLDENSIQLADLLEFNDLYNIYLLPGTTIKVPAVEEVK